MLHITALMPQGVLESEAAAGIMRTRTPGLLSEGDDERAMSPLLERQPSSIPVSRKFVPVFHSVQTNACLHAFLHDCRWHDD